jgi:hypothetical protein
MRAHHSLLMAGMALALAACGPAAEAPAPEPAAPAAEAAPAVEAPAEAVPAETAPAEAAAVVTTPDGQTFPEAQAGCLDAVAKATNTDRAGLVVTKLNSAESGISVFIQVPGATGPWFCLANVDGTVQGTEFRGDEGAL